MPIHERIVTDGITSRVETVISAPRTEDELRENKAALVAYMTECNRRMTFDGCVADLERVCRRDLPASNASPAIGSRPWYAREITGAIDAARHWLKNGQPDFAASEAVVVGMLAAEAEARHHWPIVQLGIKNRQSTQAAGRTRGKTIAEDARLLSRQIRQTVSRYKASDDRLTIRKLAKDLEKSAITIQRHLTKMGLSLPKR